MAEQETIQPVVTRFAPSPTGLLHVGGARTALFAWAYARGRGGKFILRLEDTDRKRSNEASADAILADLKWLGIDWDQGPDIGGPTGPYRQSERLDLYNKQIQKLIDAGQAYEDDGAIRFRMDRNITFTDAVYGVIEVKENDLEDFVIKKADGFPTFHLAVVVDDAMMGVTHVIRGQEHLSNTAKHAALYDALNFDRPTWCHTPSIMNPDGSKMSKRDKAKVARAAAKQSELKDARFEAFLNKDNDDLDLAVAIADKLGIHLPEIDVRDFRDSGYLPEVLCNYIALLGWNPGNNIERFDLNFLKEHFDFGRIGKANAKFDRDKLAAFSGNTLQNMPPEAFASVLKTYMVEHHAEIVVRLGDQFENFAAAYQPRSKTLADPASQGAFFFIADDAMVFDEKAVKKNLTKNEGEGFAMLRVLRERFDTIKPWSGDAAHTRIQQLSEEQSIKLGKIAQPLRVAIAGNAVSPPIDMTLDILGKTSTLARIDRCLACLTSS